MKLLFDYHIINDLLVSMGAICSASELHGMLSGQIAGGRTRTDEDWVGQMREFADLSHFDITAQQEQVALFLVNETQKALADDHFSFNALLPEDVCPLSDRVNELGVWCRGFLHGFGASGVTKDTELSAEVAEVLRDLAQISQTSSQADLEDNDDELNEADWYELAEYLRAGAVTVYVEMTAVSPPEVSKHLH